MANTGRTVSKYTRLYGGTAAFGLDLSADTTAFGEIGLDADFTENAAYSWEVKGGILGFVTQALGPINQVLNSDGTTLAHDKLAAVQGTLVTLMLALGIREAPTYGTDIVGGQWELKSYVSDLSDGMVTVNMQLAKRAGVINYPKFFGKLLHPLGAETAANTGKINVVNNGAATTAGGYLVYCVTALDAGTVAVSVDDSADNITYGALSGATSGALAAPAAGIVQLGTTATVKQYLRFQVALAGGASTATFALGFVRG